MPRATFTGFYPHEPSGKGGPWIAAHPGPSGSFGLFPGSAAVSETNPIVPAGTIIQVDPSSPGYGYGMGPNKDLFYIHDTGPGVGSNQIDIMSQALLDTNSPGGFQVVGSGSKDWAALTSGAPSTAPPASEPWLDAAQYFATPSVPIDQAIQPVIPAGMPPIDSSQLLNTGGPADTQFSPTSTPQNYNDLMAMLTNTAADAARPGFTDLSSVVSQGTFQNPATNESMTLSPVDQFLAQNISTNEAMSPTLSNWWDTPQNVTTNEAMSPTLANWWDTPQNVTTNEAMSPTLANWWDTPQNVTTNESMTLSPVDTFSDQISSTANAATIDLFSGIDLTSTAAQDLTAQSTSPVDAAAAAPQDPMIASLAQGPAATIEGTIVGDNGMYFRFDPVTGTYQPTGVMAPVSANSTRAGFNTLYSPFAGGGFGPQFSPGAGLQSLSGGLNTSVSVPGMGGQIVTTPSGQAYSTAVGMFGLGAMNAAGGSMPVGIGGPASHSEMQSMSDAGLRGIDTGPHAMAAFDARQAYLASLPPGPAQYIIGWDWQRNPGAGWSGGAAGKQGPSATGPLTNPKGWWAPRYGPTPPTNVIPFQGAATNISPTDAMALLTGTHG